MQIHMVIVRNSTPLKRRRNSRRLPPANPRRPLPRIAQKVRTAIWSLPVCVCCADEYYTKLSYLIRLGIEYYNGDWCWCLYHWVRFSLSVWNCLKNPLVEVNYACRYVYSVNIHTEVQQQTYCRLKWLEKMITRITRPFELSTQCQSVLVSYHQNTTRPWMTVWPNALKTRSAGKHDRFRSRSPNDASAA